jgi:hypothetical protein
MSSAPANVHDDHDSSSDEQNQSSGGKKGLILARGNACDICRKRKLVCVDSNTSKHIVRGPDFENISAVMAAVPLARLVHNSADNAATTLASGLQALILQLNLASDWRSYKRDLISWLPNERRVPLPQIHPHFLRPRRKLERSVYLLPAPNLHHSLKKCMKVHPRKINFICAFNSNYALNLGFTNHCRNTTASNWLSLTPINVLSLYLEKGFLPP